MDYPQQENVWMTCLNCDYIYNMDEFFANDFYGSCPLCESKSCIETTDTDNTYSVYIEDETYD